jgi:hypothetical protein
VEVYEVQVQAALSSTFRVIASDPQEAITRANQIFCNDHGADIDEMQFSVWLDGHKLLPPRQLNQG